MRVKILLLLLLLFSPCVARCDDAATALLDKAVANIQADAAVQLAFACAIFDSEGNVLSTGEGSLKIDDNRYVLLLDDIKIWCDGETQWNYMAQTNEIYITDAGSEEAQNFSPIYLMQLYKQGYDAEVRSEGGRSVVLLTAVDASNGIDKVQVFLNTVSVRPEMIVINMNGQGRVEAVVNDYKPKYKLEERVYRCPLDDFKTAEIIDMR